MSDKERDRFSLSEPFSRHTFLHTGPKVALVSLLAAACAPDGGASREVKNLPPTIPTYHGTTAITPLIGEALKETGFASQWGGEVCDGIYSMGSMIKRGVIPTLNRHYVQGMGNIVDLWVTAPNPNAPNPAGALSKAMEYAGHRTIARVFNPQIAEQNLAWAGNEIAKLEGMISQGKSTPVLQEQLQFVRDEATMKGQQLQFYYALQGVRGEKGDVLRRALSTSIVMEFNTPTDATNLNTAKTTTSVIVRDGYLPYSNLRTVYVDSAADTRVVELVKSSVQKYAPDVQVVTREFPKVVQESTLKWYDALSYKIAQGGNQLVNEWLPLFGTIAFLFGPEGRLVVDFNKAYQDFLSAKEQGLTNMNQTEWVEAFNSFVASMQTDATLGDYYTRTAEEQNKYWGGLWQDYQIDSSERTVNLTAPKGTPVHNRVVDVRAPHFGSMVVDKRGETEEAATFNMKIRLVGYDDQKRPVIELIEPADLSKKIKEQRRTATLKSADELARGEEDYIYGCGGYATGTPDKPRLLTSIFFVRYRVDENNPSILHIMTEAEMVEGNQCPSEDIFGRNPQ